MSKNKRKNVCVTFCDPESAAEAFKRARREFPLRIPHAFDLSRVSGSTVIFQIDSAAASSFAIRQFLLDCDGAIPA